MTAYSFPARSYITKVPPRVSLTVIDDSKTTWNRKLSAGSYTPGDTVECDLNEARALLVRCPTGFAKTDPAAFDAAAAAFDALPITPDAK